MAMGDYSWICLARIRSFLLSFFFDEPPNELGPTPTVLIRLMLSAEKWPEPVDLNYLVLDLVSFGRRVPLPLPSLLS